MQNESEVPIGDDNNLFGKNKNGCVILRTDFGLTVQICAGRGQLTMTEELAEKLSGKVCGLCGEHN